MKILIVNSSHRKKSSSMTRYLLNYLSQGMIDAGGSVELIDLKTSEIKECTGCFTCWNKTPGKCVLQDQMTREILPKWISCDLIVYGTPIFQHHMNSLMARFRERTIPGSPPYTSNHNHTMQDEPLPVRREVPLVVWFSICGLDRFEEFEHLSRYVQSTCPSGSTLVAEIYRTAAQHLRHPINTKIKNKVIKAIQAAGKEIVTMQKVSRTTLEQIQQPLTDIYNIKKNRQGSLL